MKTVTAEKLMDAYESLYPDEKCTDKNDGIRIYGNWLGRYHTDPSDAIRGANWYGKVTKALFKALNIKQPKTVKAMLDALKD